MNAEHSLNASANNSKQVSKLKLRGCSQNFWANFETFFLSHEHNQFQF